MGIVFPAAVIPGAALIRWRLPRRALDRLRTNARITCRPHFRRAGFTLIELLVVMVVIAILAATAIPKFQNTKGKANLAAMKSDLRNLANAEEAYLFDHGAYAAATAQLSFAHSPGVIVMVIEGTSSGWSAQATHPASYPVTCAIYWGSVPAPDPATIEGVIGCR